MFKIKVVTTMTDWLSEFDACLVTGDPGTSSIFFLPVFYLGTYLPRTTHIASSNSARYASHKHNHMPFLASSAGASKPSSMLPLLIVGAAATAGLCTFIKRKSAKDHDIHHRCVGWSILAY